MQACDTEHPNERRVVEDRRVGQQTHKIDSGVLINGAIKRRTLRPWRAFFIATAIGVISGCGGSSSSGDGARFLEAAISFRNLGSEVECDNTIVDKGPLPGGGNFRQCTWACGVGGPLNVNREFYRRRWERSRASEPYTFKTESVDQGLCL